MATEDSPQVDELFHDAVQLAPGRERDAYLDAACNRNAELRRRLDRLLRASDAAGSFLEAPATGGSPSFDPGLLEQVGTRVGSFKLLQQIGEGGFGVVFMAEQTHPLRRKVALKVIKPGMDTKQVVARFESERQALALMDHPNIARVLDGGATESGRPYFVMELVQGVPITDFCNAERLTPTERLKLFVDVCHGVQHAHQKGVIHRDLKPSNIMVTMHDDKPVPKIIDFGVSKAISQQLTERTLFTAYGQMVGTPMYMSPEQAQLSGLDADTRSDVYSLGVLLYELVTGTTVFDEDTLKRASLDELRRMIQEDEPLPPSSRIGTLDGKSLATVADQRRIDPRRLRRTLRGEVDWIVMKALEKNRDRRYESVGTLVADIERFLNDEPVLACPPRISYRFRKFARRHKRALATVGMLCGLLVLGIVSLAVSTVVIWRANEETKAALEKGRRLAYFQRVALAEREWSSNNLARAEELIDQCPADLRGWEWHYLKRLRGKQITPLRHDNGVWGCAVSPDGMQIVTIDFSGRLYCWNAHTGREIRPPVRAHMADGGEVAFSPDGHRFATSGWGEVKIWDAGSGQLHHTWKTSEGSVQGIAYVAENALLACVCTATLAKEESRIWNVVTGQQLFAIADLEEIVHDVACSPDGTLLALACGDGTVRVVDSRTGHARQTFRGVRRFWSVSFSPDGRFVAGGTGTEAERGSGVVRIWDIGSGQEVSTLTGHGARSIAFTPDSKRLATGGIDQSVKLWDKASGQEIFTLRGHQDWVQVVAFTRKGQRLVSASHDRTVRVWDATPWDGAEKVGGEPITLRSHSDSVNALAFHPWLPRLATASSDGTIRFWEAATGRELRMVQTTLEKVDGLTFHPQGKRLAYIGKPHFGVRILDADTGEPLQQFGDNVASVAMSVAFNAQGDTLAVADDDGSVTLFDASSGRVLDRLTAPLTPLMQVEFSPRDNGRLVAAAALDGSLRIWDTQRGQETEESPLSHQGVIYGLAFSPDARLLASASWDRTVRLWNTTTWEQGQMVIDTATAALCVAFSPDNNLLAWGGSDSSVKLWDCRSGEIRTLRGHLGWIRDVAFSPDGRSLASASNDGTVKIWPVNNEETTP